MDLLFELLQVALGQRNRLSRNPSDEDWQRLFQMAEEQAITSFLFPALEILNKCGQKPPVELLLEWIGLAEQDRSQNELMNSEAARLTALFENEGHRTAILKGQANARLYNCHTEPMEQREQNHVSHELCRVATEEDDSQITENTERVATTLLRLPGDIDIWVSGGKERVVKTLGKLHLIDGGISKYLSAEKALDGYHHIHLPKNENEVSVEVHFRPSSGNYDPFTNRRLQKYLNQEIERENEMVGEGFRVPSLRFALLMQLAHIQRHALETGIELRRVIDYYYLLKSDAGHERETIKGMLKEMGLDHIAAALMWVMKEVLLMDEGWMIANPDEKRGRILLDIIMGGDHFGFISAKNRQAFSFVRSLMYHIRKFELLRFDARETIWGELNYYGNFMTSIPERIRRSSWTLR